MFNEECAGHEFLRQFMVTSCCKSIKKNPSFLFYFFIYKCFLNSPEILSCTSYSVTDIYQEKNGEKNSWTYHSVIWTRVPVISHWFAPMHCCLMCFSVLEMYDDLHPPKKNRTKEERKLLLSILQRDVTEDHLSTIVLAPLWTVWQATKALTFQSHRLLPNREVLASQWLHLVHTNTLPYASPGVARVPL